jgi:hypothetical protein
MFWYERAWKEETKRNSITIKRTLIREQIREKTNGKRWKDISKENEEKEIKRDSFPNGSRNRRKEESSSKRRINRRLPNRWSRRIRQSKRTRRYKSRWWSSRSKENDLPCQKEHIKLRRWTLQSEQPSERS